MNQAFFSAFIDELSKHAESFRSLGLTDPKARKNFSKALRMMPKGGPEGRHEAIRQSKEGFAHWNKKPMGRAMISQMQQTMAEAKIP